jgi:hypothetical protein
MFSQGYIGVSNDFEKRLISHKKQTGRHLKFAITKYGWDNLIKQQILVAEKDYCLDIERKLRPTDDIGWNCTTGGGYPPLSIGNKYREGKPAWNKGMKMSDETRKKVSLAAKEQWQRLGMREILSNAKKGKPSHMLGKKHTSESIAKMRAVKLGKIPSKETIEKRAAKLRGKSVTKLTCPKCNTIGGFGAMKRWHFDNCRKGI